jgi:hypothetical protein
VTMSVTASLSVFVLVSISVPVSMFSMNMYMHHVSRHILYGTAWTWTCSMDMKK